MERRQIGAEFIVEGYVQGVGFRYFVWRTAAALGLKGYVKNLYDGNVKVVAEGYEEKINDLYEYLKVGPSRAMVKNVIYEKFDFTGSFKEFDVY